jgi:uncharacterized membrane protein YbhN (UPF0104 family)
MLNEFVNGFFCASRHLIWFSGFLSAVLLGLLILALVVAIASHIFDRYTSWIARRIRKKKRKPRNLLERIILEHDADAV